MKLQETAINTTIISLILCLLFGNCNNNKVSAKKFYEYEVKAFYLYSFAKFFTWPDSALADTSEPIIIGILGTDPFKDNLELIAKTKTVNGHTISIEQSNHLEDLADCHILFISFSEKNNWEKIRDSVRNASILTVSDWEGFADQGGMLELISRGRKIKYNINISVVNNAGLRADYKLLNLANKVIVEGS